MKGQVSNTAIVPSVGTTPVDSGESDDPSTSARPASSSVATSAAASRADAPALPPGLLAPLPWISPLAPSVDTVGLSSVPDPLRDGAALSEAPCGVVTSTGCSGVASPPVIGTVLPKPFVGTGLKSPE